VVMSGVVTMNINRKDHKPGPGAYIAQPDKTWHVAKVEGNEEVIGSLRPKGRGTPCPRSSV